MHDYIFNFVGREEQHRFRLFQELANTHPCIRMHPVSATTDLMALADSLHGFTLCMSIESVFSRAKKTLFFQRILQNTHTLLLNDVVVTNPSINDKLYQQEVLALHNLAHIPTYAENKFTSLHSYIDSGALAYPFVIKKHVGSQGHDVHLVRSATEYQALTLDMRDYIAQPFIKNDGDYRVLVLDGTPLGAMKRVAKQGDFRNNFSQGGSVYHEQDPEILKELYPLAIRATTVFGLAYCGVDIIYDNTQRRFLVMEINTAPGWEGFSAATGIDVSAVLLSYGKKRWEAHRQ